jgi:hypothetical protein
MLLQGRITSAYDIVGDDNRSTPSNDALPSRLLDLMLSDPPYGKS